MNNDKKILAGITKDNELYFLEINADNNQRNGYDEFSMSGFTVKPVREEEVKEQAREYLRDEGEDMWRDAVAAKRTTDSLADWIEQLENEDDMGSFDNSLFDESVTIDDEVWLFESGACGQHEEHDLKHYFIPETQFKAIMKLWQDYHLKATPTGSTIANTVMIDALAIKQDIAALAIEAINIINA